MTTEHPERPRQSGMALIEALIASAILGMGLVGATQLALKTLSTASLNRHHTLAQHLAQEAMDCLVAQAQPGRHDPTRPCPAEERLQVQGVTFTRQAQTTPGAVADLTDLKVRVSWPAHAPNRKSHPGPVHSQADHEIEWHSSVSALPTWVGVSSP